MQGSGRIELSNNNSILVGYDSQNRLPYGPIGSYFLENNLIPREKITIQSIKKWLCDHPKDSEKVLNYDPSFVFFRVRSHLNPIGGQGVH